MNDTTQEVPVCEAPTMEAIVGTVVTEAELTLEEFTATQVLERKNGASAAVAEEPKQEVPTEA